MSSQPNQFPESYEHESQEPKWGKLWEQRQIYKWDPSQPRENTFVVDTPPPTVSGSLHVGHVFSYTQTDVLVRYHRMRGKNIFYPIGWDDNGLPTERRVQNYFNLRCEAHLPYIPNWSPEKPSSADAPPTQVSRNNFIEACALLTREDEKAFENLWRRLGLSYDWSLQYETINTHCRKVSQLSFLDLVKKKQVYNVLAPTMWDVDFKSAVAQAEVQERERPGAFHDVRFAVEGGGEFTIATTRPELLPACIAVVAHPSDERYQKLFGKFAITPLFHARVPILAAEHADPEKGSGILMVCTFGDIHDVHWWKQSKLPLKQVIGLDGRFLPATFGAGAFTSENPKAAQAHYQQLTGLYVNQAQRKVVELLSQEGSGPGGQGRALVGEPKPITHPVKFYENGQRALEFVPTRQWFIRVLEHKDALLAQGRKIKWHPEHMLTRYEHWVMGLNQDWCISRQRYFGVPFPVWYPIDAAGTIQYDRPIFADEKSLPVDPLSEAPAGYKPEQRGQPGGFSGDPDVMDTWATSSLTPQIESHWGVDPQRHKKLFPMDVRPQAHEIIRTWAFYTIVKAWMHDNEIPWKHAAISGWILDPDRKKMSKSKGNVVTPEHLLKEYSTDAVRYWAARAKLGADTAFDEGLFKIGRKLVTKLFNASRFVASQFERIGKPLGSFAEVDITEPLDQALVAKLRGVIDQASKNFENFDYSSALQETEEAFWSFCDHYLELIKVRSYKEQDSAARASAFATLEWSLRTFLRLLAPFLPYVTEEIWSHTFAGTGKSASVHTSPWPLVAEAARVHEPKHPQAYSAALEVISKIRGAKTDSKVSLKCPVDSLTVTGKAENLAALKLVLEDVLHGGNVNASSVKLIEATPKSGAFDVELVLGKMPE
jgi:valyl-tRNA synthetase